MEDDKQLIKRYLNGDDGAVEELVEKYQKHIYAFVYRMTNDIEEAKDLTQEVFIRAVNGISGFRMESSFKTWLYRIAVNTSINHARRNRRYESGIEESVVEDRAEALSDMIEREKKDLVREGLARLPERQRIAIVLRAYEGLSCRETALAMGCSEGAVKAHYHNGVKRLREIVTEAGYEFRP